MANCLIDLYCNKMFKPVHSLEIGKKYYVVSFVLDKEECDHIFILEFIDFWTKLPNRCLKLLGISLNKDTKFEWCLTYHGKIDDSIHK